jgi:hypothetical protein
MKSNVILSLSEKLYLVLNLMNLVHISITYATIPFIYICYMNERVRASEQWKYKNSKEYNPMSFPQRGLQKISP